MESPLYNDLATRATRRNTSALTMSCVLVSSPSAAGHLLGALSVSIVVVNAMSYINILLFSINQDNRACQQELKTRQNQNCKNGKKKKIALFLYLESCNDEKLTIDDALTCPARKRLSRLGLQEHTHTHLSLGMDGHLRFFSRQAGSFIKRVSTCARNALSRVASTRYSKLKLPILQVVDT